MTYADLLPMFAAFHRGEISKIEVALAIGMWQEQGARLDRKPTPEEATE